MVSLLRNAKGLILTALLGLAFVAAPVAADHTSTGTATHCGWSETDTDGDGTCDRLDNDNDNDGVADGCDPNPNSRDTVTMLLDWARYSVVGCALDLFELGLFAETPIAIAE